MSCSTFLPLTTLALSIDLFWAIEPGWAMRAKAALDMIDVGMHTVEYAQRAPRRLNAGVDAYDDDDEVIYSSRREREDKDRKPYKITDGVAYLYLTGPLTKRPQSWGCGTSTVLFRRALRQAVADVDVKAILIVIDSPGGQVAGTCDAACDVAWASNLKPVATYCEDLCCSAAYWIGCAAGYGMFCNRIATVGSIGTITVLVDSSEAAAEAGIKLHVVATGDRKGIGIAGTPVTEEQLDYVHAYLDQLNAAFTGMVKRNRKLSATSMMEVARAGIYVGPQAVEMGLCCGIHSLDEVHKMLVGAEGKASARYAPLPDGQEDRDPVPAPSQPKPEARIAMVDSSIGQDVLSAHLPTVTTTPAARSSVPGMENVKMKEKLVRALTMLGLQRMAVAVVGAADDTPETMAQAMSGQVNAEVDERIAAHPLILQCGAVGVTTAADFAAFNDMAILGRAHLGQLRTDAKGQAIRAFGGELGPQISAQVDHMPAGQVRALLASWQAQGDATFGHGKDGSAPERKSAPKGNPEALLATEGPEAAGKQTAWDQLKPEHQGYAEKLLGRDATAEQKEAFAVQALKDLGE